MIILLFNVISSRYFGNSRHQPRIVSRNGSVKIVAYAHRAFPNDGIAESRPFRTIINLSLSLSLFLLNILIIIITGVKHYIGLAVSVDRSKLNRGKQTR